MGLYNSKIDQNKSHSLNIGKLKSTSSDVLNESISNISNSYFENGRKYTTQNKTYSLPNDYEEHSRLNLQHIINRYIWQSNFSAPVERLLNQEDTKVLDVGTGAGSWAIDVATNYPKAKFIGVDLSPVQPDLDKPKNVEFMEANVLERLPFDDNTFDYVFQRLLTSALPAKKWPSVINELVRVLKPGGYLELMEIEFQYRGNMGPGTKKIDNGMVTMFYDRGVDPQTCYKLQGYLKEHNQLCNVHCEIKETHNIDKKLRKLQIKNLSAALMGIKPKLMTIIEVSSAEYDDLIKTVEKELSEFDCYHPHVRVYAQKKV